MERGLLSWLWASRDHFTVYPSSSQENALAVLIPHRTMTLDLEQPGMGERPSSGMQRRPRPGMEPERWWRPWLVLSQRAPQELTLRAAPATQSAPSERQRIQAGPAAGQCGMQQWVGGAEAGAAISCEQQRGLAPEAVSERCLGACTGRPWDVSLHMRPTCLNTSFL